MINEPRTAWLTRALRRHSPEKTPNLKEKNTLFNEHPVNSLPIDGHNWSGPYLDVDPPALDAERVL